MLEARSGLYGLTRELVCQEDVPLVVPEINKDKISNHKGLIANPNCTTAIAAIPLHVVNIMAGIERIIFTTYQSASGAGNGGRKELLKQSVDVIPKGISHETK